MFITIVTIFCLGDVCNLPKTFDKVTINSNDIIEVADFQYYWNNEGKVEENGHFTPNKNATRMDGCKIKTKNRQFPYFMDIPCSTTRAKLDSLCQHQSK